MQMLQVSYASHDETRLRRLCPLESRLGQYDSLPTVFLRKNRPGGNYGLAQYLPHATGDEPINKYYWIDFAKFASCNFA